MSHQNKTQPPLWDGDIVQTLPCISTTSSPKSKNCWTRREPGNVTNNRKTKYSIETELEMVQMLKLIAAAAAKSLQSCPTLCDPIDGSPAGSPIPGILRAWTLEWVAISFSKAWKWKVKVKSLSHVRLLATPWTAPYQAHPSMGFSRQEYWSGLPLPSPEING